MIAMLPHQCFPPVATKATGCQLVEEAVTGRALSTRSCTGRPTPARCPRGGPASYTTRRRAAGIFPPRIIEHVAKECIDE